VKHYRALEFARRAGVTVRTLHHYDRLGLLRPAGRSETGYRLYSDPDLLRLEQILVLKLIGLGLKDIRTLLERDDGTALPEVLARQQRVLALKREHLDRALRAIGLARDALSSAGAPDWASFITLIREITMQNTTSWQKQYFGEEAQARLQSRAHLWSPELQQRVGAEWSALYRDIEAALNEDPAGAKARALAGRWNALVREFTGGDPGIQEGLNRMYADVANWPAERRAWAPRPEVREFIAKALAAAAVPPGGG
jgi:DNA-binding transcriptional MerR regulator